jgi:hypothetical protein
MGKPDVILNWCYQANALIQVSTRRFESPSDAKIVVSCGTELVASPVLERMKEDRVRDSVG